MKFFARALVATAILAAPCAASAEVQQATMVVRLNGVNIHTQAGAKVALRRIERAAAAFCDQSDPASRIRNVDAACKTRMVAKAVASVDTSTALAQLYRSTQPTVLAVVD